MAMSTRARNCKFAENIYTAPERLICLITLLADQRWHTTDHLARQFGTTERTILRDLDRVESAAKVSIERRPGKGVRVVSKFHFKGIEAGAEESLNLILAVAFSPRIGYSLAQVARTLEKLRDMLPPELASQVDWYRSRFHLELPAHTDGLRFLDLLRKAIIENRRIRMTHLGVGDGTTDAHMINPYGLVYYHDKWFLIGFDFNSAERRVFRVDRFEECELLPARFDPPDDFDAQEHWYKVFWKQYGRNAETFVLVFDSEYRERVSGWDSATRREAPGGGLEVRVKAMNPEWVKNFVLSCGRHCTVMEPAWLRDIVHKEAQAMCALYEGARQGKKQKGRTRRGA